MKFVAEFTTNHLGNFNLLRKMAQQAAAVGCDYIKMQKKDVCSFYSQDELNRPYPSPYGKTFGDYRTMFEFDAEDHARFSQFCSDLGIPWFSTVQDMPSLQFMLRYQLPLCKIASSNARNIQLLREVELTIPLDTPIVLSVAGLKLAEIEISLKALQGHFVHLLHCVAEYPCSPSNLRLGNIDRLITEFADGRVSVGYSGHEEGLAPTFAAIDRGAQMIERHFCLSRHSFAHHIACSLEPDEYRHLINTVRSGTSLAGTYSDLPATAFDSSFGMTELEGQFLVNRRYAGEQ